MKQIALTDAQRKAIHAICEAAHCKPFDPMIDFKVESMFSTQDISSVLKELRSNRHLYFSVLSPSRKQVIEQVQNGSFPAKQFCAVSPKIALMFTRGHRSYPRHGDPAPICVLEDTQAILAGSPSVLQKGSSENADRSASHHITSSSVRLIAVLQTKVSSVTSESKDKEDEDDEEDEGQIFGNKINEKAKIKMRKIRRKRMDNFGIKGDF